MEKDLRSSNFFSDNERYADIINGFGCDGDAFVTGEDLQELDTKVIRGKGKGRKIELHFLQKFNVLKYKLVYLGSFHNVTSAKYFS